MLPSQIDFGNILFGGPCNRRCPDCIAHRLPSRVNRSNLDEFPLRNIDEFICAVNRYGIRRVILTATNTDPQLYCCESELLEMLRERIQTGAEYALHTNGVLALQKMPILRKYDKVTISVPSFIPETYALLMGVPDIPDIARIVEQAGIPVKLSMLLSEENVSEIPQYIRFCAEIGVKRVVLRRRYGETREREILKEIQPLRFYRNNPVYNIEGVEVTYWIFETTTSTSLNLYADGTLSTSYLLAQSPEFGANAVG
jgi:MoaA/NifB/PqqE/SkfB family radical SAM enzyme